MRGSPCGRPWVVDAPRVVRGASFTLRPARSTIVADCQFAAQARVAYKRQDAPGGVVITPVATLSIEPRRMDISRNACELSL